jgi:AcrR family transcriptional regulator
MGRPLEFDPNEALGKAMELFRRQGYEGTSLTDLTDSSTQMGFAQAALEKPTGASRQALRRVAEMALRVWPS